MESLADQNNFIVLWPIATQNPLSNPNTCSTYIWESYALGYIWTTTTNPSCQPGNSHVEPDDSGFIRSLINSMRTNNGITTVYVAGMSSGAFMAHRVGLDSTLHDTIPVQAVGAASGQIYAAKHGTTFTMHQPSSQSVAVVMLNGDQDTTVPYCGRQDGKGWGNSDFPKSDVSLDYWANANNPNGCSPALPQLCNPDGTVNQQVTTYSCGNVTFSREVNISHCWVTGTESRMWTFFTTGILPATSETCPN
jgi:poly(3-hydroxybutyrate) depolymerase